jgi:formylmethanofuran dehydrogenase subunit D
VLTGAQAVRLRTPIVVEHDTLARVRYRAGPSGWAVFGPDALATGPARGSVEFWNSSPSWRVLAGYTRIRATYPTGRWPVTSSMRTVVASVGRSAGRPVDVLHAVDAGGDTVVAIDSERGDIVVRVVATDGSLGNEVVLRAGQWRRVTDADRTPGAAAPTLAPVPSDPSDPVSASVATTDGILEALGVP